MIIFSNEIAEGFELFTGREFLLTFIVSVVSLVISTVTLFINSRNEKRKMSLDHITQNRINWIADVRNLIKDFLSIYVTENNKESKINLIRIRSKIALYLRDEVSSYNALLNQLDKCIVDDYNDDDYKKLIFATQYVLSEVWIRMKREAGISEKEDNKFRKMFEKKFRENFKEEFNNCHFKSLLKNKSIKSNVKIAKIVKRK